MKQPRPIKTFAEFERALDTEKSLWYHGYKGNWRKVSTAFIRGWSYCMIKMCLRSGWFVRGEKRPA